MGSLQKLQQFGKGPENAAELLGRFIGTSLGVKWQIRENQKQNCQS